jgi:hypothetical protein
MYVRGCQSRYGCDDRARDDGLVDADAHTLPDAAVARRRFAPQTGLKGSEVLRKAETHEAIHTARYGTTREDGREGGREAGMIFICRGSSG